MTTSFWTIVGSIFGGIGAIATVCSILWARRAKEQEIALEERRRMENVLPHLAILVKCPDDDQATGTLAQNVVSVENKGKGLACNIAVNTDPRVTNVEDYRIESEPWSPVLAPGEKFFLACQIVSNDTPDIHDVSVTYMDEVGRKFRSSIVGNVTKNVYTIEKLPRGESYVENRSGEP